MVLKGTSIKYQLFVPEENLLRNDIFVDMLQL